MKSKIIDKTAVVRNYASNLDIKVTSKLTSA